MHYHANEVENCDEACITCKRAKSRGGTQEYVKFPPRDLRTVNPVDVVHMGGMDTMETIVATP